MSPLLRCLCIAIGLLAASAAHAERFDVSVRVFCPASWNEAADHLDTSFTTAVDRPCAGIRVVAMDADPLWDEFCGAAYTDSRGMARFRAECGDLTGGRPEVYLKVEGRSVNGFSVGLWEINHFDRLLDSLLRSITGGALPPIVQDIDEPRSHRTFEWLFAPARLVSDGQTLDFGDVALGGSFSVAISGVPAGSSEGGAVSQMAARQFWAAQYSMHRLRAGTQYRPMDFNYTVSHPFGTPTTLYDTVVVSFTNNEGEEAAKALRATAHEIGHVLYNTYHSGILHWLDDAVPHYMVSHSQCDDDHTLRLAWYEGFAHFVRDYVFQQWDWNVSNWTGEWRPYQGCAFEADGPEEDGSGQPGLHIEGNVQALLDNIFFGPVRQALREEIGVPLPDDFTCPAGQRRIVTSIGAVECEREVPITCAAGVYKVDGRGLTDQCARSVRDPSCQAFEECEPVDQLNAATCASGRALRRSGPDACLVTSPAMDALNGTPRPRPDGSPDMVIGRNTTDGRAWFALPSLDQVMQWVIAAGHDGHRAREFWEGWIRPSCLPRNGLRYQYCRPDKSPSFLDEIQKLDPNLN
jgi:hypothetical protein